MTSQCAPAFLNGHPGVAFASRKVAYAKGVFVKGSYIDPSIKLDFLDSADTECFFLDLIGVRDRDQLALTKQLRSDVSNAPVAAVPRKFRGGILSTCNAEPGLSFSDVHEFFEYIGDSAYFMDLPVSVPTLPCVACG